MFGSPRHPDRRPLGSAGNRRGELPAGSSFYDGMTLSYHAGDLGRRHGRRHARRHAGAWCAVRRPRPGGSDDRRGRHARTAIDPRGRCRAGGAGGRPQPRRRSRPAIPCAASIDGLLPEVEPSKALLVTTASGPLTELQSWISPLQHATCGNTVRARSRKGEFGNERLRTDDAWQVKHHGGRKQRSSSHRSTFERKDEKLERSAGRGDLRHVRGQAALLGVRT